MMLSLNSEEGAEMMGAGEEPPVDVGDAEKVDRVSTEWKIGSGDEPIHAHHALIYRMGESTS